MFASLLAASTSNRYFLLEQTGQVSFLPLGKKNSLESRNSVCVCVRGSTKSPSSRETAKRKPSSPNRALFRLFEPSSRFPSIFSLLFFRRFHPAVAFHSDDRSTFPMRHGQSFETTVNDFESAQEATRGGVGRGGSIFEPFLRRCFSFAARRNSWMKRCARNGNRKFFGCPTGESVESVGVALLRIFFLEGC